MPTAACPHCAGHINYKPSQHGRMIACPSCRGELQLPHAPPPLPQELPGLAFEADKGGAAPSRLIPPRLASYQSEPWYYPFLVALAYLDAIGGFALALFSLVTGIGNIPSDYSRAQVDYAVTVQIETSAGILLICLSSAAIQLALVDIGRRVRRLCPRV